MNHSKVDFLKEDMIFEVINELSKFSLKAPNSLFSAF